jgi:hypothetical protein
MPIGARATPAEIVVEALNSYVNVARTASDDDSMNNPERKDYSSESQPGILRSNGK